MDRFRRLEAWQACMRLTIEVYRAAARWPRADFYGLSAQVRQAAVSAGATIAEGFGKSSRAEFARFVDMSNGSLSEVEHLLEVAREVGLLTPAAWAELEALRQQAARLTRGLHRSLRSKGTGEQGNRGTGNTGTRERGSRGDGNGGRGARGAGIVGEGARAPGGEPAP